MIRFCMRVAKGKRLHSKSRGVYSCQPFLLSHHLHHRCQHTLIPLPSPQHTMNTCKERAHLFSLTASPNPTYIIPLSTPPTPCPLSFTAASSNAKTGAALTRPPPRNPTRPHHPAQAHPHRPTPSPAPAPPETRSRTRTPSPPTPAPSKAFSTRGPRNCRSSPTASKA